MVLADIHKLVRECLDAQHAATAAWHHAEPVKEHLAQGLDAQEYMRRIVLVQHWCNFSLWHVEDVARRRDVRPEVIADCKYRIDALNQERNDCMEKVDAGLVDMLTPLLPAKAKAKYNTESLGMAVDRLSILSLKIWHMDEQAERLDADATHRQNCAAKAAVLREQRADLTAAVADLLDAYALGEKRPKLYYQFKMYNDPSLNPELYSNSHLK